MYCGYCVDASSPFVSRVALSGTQCVLRGKQGGNVLYCCEPLQHTSAAASGEWVLGLDMPFIH